MRLLNLLALSAVSSFVRTSSIPRAVPQREENILTVDQSNEIAFSNETTPSSNLTRAEEPPDPLTIKKGIWHMRFKKYKVHLPSRLLSLDLARDVAQQLQTLLEHERTLADASRQDPFKEKIFRRRIVTTDHRISAYWTFHSYERTQWNDLYQALELFNQWLDMWHPGPIPGFSFSCGYVVAGHADDRGAGGLAIVSNFAADHSPPEVTSRDLATKLGSSEKVTRPSNAILPVNLTLAAVVSGNQTATNRTRSLPSDPMVITKGGTKVVFGHYGTRQPRVLEERIFDQLVRECAGAIKAEALEDERQLSQEYAHPVFAHGLILPTADPWSTVITVAKDATTPSPLTYRALLNVMDIVRDWGDGWFPRDVPQMTYDCFDEVEGVWYHTAFGRLKLINEVSSVSTSK